MENARRNFLDKLISIKKSKGLEIGALTSPIVTSKDLCAEGEIFYLDHLSTEDLKLKYADDGTVDCEKIVSVDFICPNGDIKSSVDGNTFDYVIASHVIEHSPNIIRFLEEIFEILRPGGVLFLVVPDKRFTFDVNRPETSFGTLLEAYLSKRSKPGVSAVYDHLSYAVSIDAGKIWQEPVDTLRAKTLAPLSLAWKTACDLEESGKYVDVHVNIFTPHSFLEVLKKMLVHDICSFQLKGFRDTEIGQLDFCVALCKPGGAASNRSVAEILSDFPKLALESLLSPYMPQVKALSTTLEKTTDIIKGLQKQMEQQNLAVQTLTIEKDKIASELKVAQKVLDRRSVKLTMRVTDKVFSWFRKRNII